MSLKLEARTEFPNPVESSGCFLIMLHIMTFTDVLIACCLYVCNLKAESSGESYAKGEAEGRSRAEKRIET